MTFRSALFFRLLSFFVAANNTGRDENRQYAWLGSWDTLAPIVGYMWPARLSRVVENFGICWLQLAGICGFGILGYFGSSCRAYVEGTSVICISPICLTLIFCIIYTYIYVYICIYIYVYIYIYMYRQYIDSI